jgi:hypothetical protein
LGVRGDDDEARKLLASGRPIHIPHDDTPARNVIRVHPNGAEKLVQRDLEAARNIGR